MTNIVVMLCWHPNKHLTLKLIIGLLEHPNKRKDIQISVNNTKKYKHFLIKIAHNKYIEITVNSNE